MDKYKLVKSKLKGMGLPVGDKEFITDVKRIEDYTELVKDGQDLPDGIQKEDYRRVKSNGDIYIETRFYKPRGLSDEQIQAMIEVKQTKALMTIATSMKFITSLIIVVLVFLLFGGFFE